MARKPKRPDDARGSPPGEYGQKPHEVTQESKDRILAYASAGLSQLQMIELEGISQDTLQRHYREQLDGGKPLANAKVRAKLFAQAMDGNTVAMIFWLKCQDGWVEPKAPQAFIGDASPDAPPIRAELSLKVEYVDPPAALPPPSE